MNRLNVTLRTRLSTEPERGSALLGAVLFSVLIAGMAVVLLSIIVTAVYPATLAQARGRTVYNAEAGLQSALGILRAAKVSPATVDPKTGSYLGDRSKLPCSIAGTTDGTAGSQEKYAVSLRYYIDSPSGKDEAWRAANALACPLTSTQPYFALIEATGLTGAVGANGSAGDRKLSAIYEFTVSNERILGGRIWNYGAGQYCLEATGTPPASGEPSPVINVKFTPRAQCVAAKNATQLWQYTTDWQIKLSSTTAADGSGGYCITTPMQTTTTSTAAVREAVTDQTWNTITTTGSGTSLSGVRVQGTTGTFNSPSSVTNTQSAWASRWEVRFGGTTNYSSTNATPAVVLSDNEPTSGLTATRTQYTYKTTYTDTYKVGTVTRTVSRVYTYKQYAYNQTTTTTNTSYAAELHPCVARTTSYGWAQVFAWSGEATWWGLIDTGTHNAVSDGSTTGACLWSGRYSSGTETAWTPTLLMLGKPTKVSTGAEASQERCASQQYWGSFNPEPAVGAGRATPNFHDGQADPITKQIVSFKEFGRCADVTGANITNADGAGEFNIVYPCKQAPSGTTAVLAWNHKWNYNPPTVGYTVTTPIWVNNGSANYCLQTPDPATTVKYPIWAACGVTNPSTTLPTAARLQWTRYEYTGVYSRSYIFVDQWNRCLTADSADPYINGGQAWSKMTVATCNGSEAQKWNAPAYLTDASFGDYREITG